MRSDARNPDAWKMFGLSCPRGTRNALMLMLSILLTLVSCISIRHMV